MSNNENMKKCEGDSCDKEQGASKWTKDDRLIQNDFLFYILLFLALTFVAYTFFDIGAGRFERKQPIYSPMSENPIDDSDLYLLIAHASW